MVGFIIINKDEGITSAQVVSKVKKILIGKNLILPKDKVGHFGTLDPLAKGVLPIAIGKATRLFDYHLYDKKEYFATFEFGYSTDTLDLAGKITETGGILPKKSDIQDYISQNIGKIEQIPPIYSAKSIDGIRAYIYARKGQTVKILPKLVEIFNFELIKEITDSSFLFKIVCSSGTYIRSIVRDMAASLKTLGVMTNLVRSKSGNFTLKDSVTLTELPAKIEEAVLSINFVLSNLEKIEVTEKDYKDLRNGIKTNFKLITNNTTVLLTQNNRIFALGEISDSYFSKIVWLA